MVREVHLSWDSDHPQPEEFNQTDWDSEDAIIDELNIDSKLKKRRRRVAKNATKSSRTDQRKA